VSTVARVRTVGKGSSIGSTLLRPVQARVPAAG